MEAQCLSNRALLLLTRTQEGPQPGQLTQGMLQTLWDWAQHTELGQKEEGDIWSDGLCLPKAPVMEPGFHERGWTPACPWGARNEFLVLLCLYVQLLLFLLSHLCLSPAVFSLLPFKFPLPSHLTATVSGCMVLGSCMGLIHNTPHSPYPPTSWLKNFIRFSHFRLNKGHTDNLWNTENLWNGRIFDLHLFYHKNCATHIFSNLLQCKRKNYGCDGDFQSKGWHERPAYLIIPYSSTSMDAEDA